MKNIFVVHADIGAAKNIVKNICLLDESIFFPESFRGCKTRLEFLLKFLYPSNYTDWFRCEYTLKQYTNYGIEMDLGDPRTNGLIPLNDQLKEILKSQHFILDLMDHETACDLARQDYVKLLSVAPETMFGLNWQIRAYTMKYGASRMFNFTFRDEKSVDVFKKRFGEKIWVDINLCNFYDMVRKRRRILRTSGLDIIPLEWIIWSKNWPMLLDYLEKYFGLSIPRNEALVLLDQWMSLHWPTDQTNDWEYKYVFKEFRPNEMCRTLMLAEQVEKYSE